jgi:hypothetical protein
MGTVARHFGGDGRAFSGNCWPTRSSPTSAPSRKLKPVDVEAHDTQEESPQGREGGVSSLTITTPIGCCRRRGDAARLVANEVAAAEGHQR